MYITLLIGAMMVNTAKQTQTDKRVVLAKALFNVTTELGLKTSELAAALGVDPSAISRLKKRMALDPDSKKGEIALHLIRIARALHALTNGDSDWMQAFMRSENKGTGGIPAQQIATLSGLMQVVRYVDAMRGKV